MKTCPQCNSIFSDDYVYCLNDGTVLVGEDGEQETVANLKFGGRVAADLSDSTSHCGACGLENRGTAKFCKRCGGALVADAAAYLGGQMSPTVAFGFAPGNDPRISPDPDATVDLHRGLFTPPQPAAVQAGQKTNRTPLVVAAIALGIVAIVIVAAIGMKSGRSTIESNNANVSASNAAARPTEVRLPARFQRNYTGTIVGKSLFMSLTRDGSDLRGEASTTRIDKLYGTIDDEGNFDLDGHENDSKLTGHYKGRIYGDGSISGEWTKPDGTHPTMFSLQQQ